MNAADEITHRNLRYGNSDFGNHSLNNISANKYDTNASFSAGAFRVQHADMTQHTVAPSWEVIVDSSGAISRTGTYINEAKTLRSSLTRAGAYWQFSAYEMVSLTKE